MRHGIYPHPTPEILAASMEEANRIAAQRTQAKRRQLEDALAATSGNVSRAAEICGYARPYFYKLVHKHGLDVNDHRILGATKRQVSLADVTSDGHPSR